MQAQFLQLLCAPLLWQRCPSLQGSAQDLWRGTIRVLAGIGGTQVAAQLPIDGPGGRAGAVAALLGNLVACTSAGLQVRAPHGTTLHPNRHHPARGGAVPHPYTLKPPLWQCWKEHTQCFQPHSIEPLAHSFCKRTSRALSIRTSPASRLFTTADR